MIFLGLDYLCSSSERRVGPSNAINPFLSAYLSARLPGASSGADRPAGMNFIIPVYPVGVVEIHSRVTVRCDETLHATEHWLLCSLLHDQNAMLVATKSELATGEIQWFRVDRV